MIAEEKRVIAKFRQLSREWPSSLWLFVGDGTLNVMRTGPKGQRMETTVGSVDPKYVVATIDIPCDGGGW